LSGKEANKVQKSVQVTAPGVNSWVEVDVPEAGPNDVLLRMKACGICGSDAMYTHIGGIPPRQGHTPLGHEPAAEIVEVGADVTGLAVGDHVVIDDLSFADGLFGNGGAQGGLTPYVVVKNAEPGRQLRVIPKDVPWDVAALNEPMAVAHHGVNRSGAKEGDKAVVLGAGPIGLGSVLSLKSKGVSNVVVVDILPERLELARKVGADAVVNSATEDVAARLTELQGPATDTLGHPGKTDTDVWIDAAGVSATVQTPLKLAKAGAVVTVVAVHKKPVEVDFQEILASEVDIRLAMGYPTEIFEVTDSIIANPEAYSAIISHRFPFEKALEALEVAKTPGAANKVMVILD